MSRATGTPPFQRTVRANASRPHRGVRSVPPHDKTARCSRPPDTPPTNPSTAASVPGASP